MNNYLGDVISIFICLWFIKTYLLHYRMTKEEAFIVREAPKVFLYPLTILVCIMLILVPLSERGLVPGVVPDSILKYTLVSFSSINDRKTDAVPSVEPSSTTIISFRKPDGKITSLTALTTFRMVPFSLNTGITTESFMLTGTSCNRW